MNYRDDLIRKISREALERLYNAEAKALESITAMRDRFMKRTGKIMTNPKQTEEIEVTPEMIEAGVEALRFRYLDLENPYELSSLSEAVIRAALEVRRKAVVA